MRINPKFLFYSEKNNSLFQISINFEYSKWIIHNKFEQNNNCVSTKPAKPLEMRVVEYLKRIFMTKAFLLNRLC